MTSSHSSLEGARNHVARALAALPDGEGQPDPIREAIQELREILREAWIDAEAIRGALVILSGDTIALRGDVLRLAERVRRRIAVDQLVGSATAPDPDAEGPRCVE